MPGRGLAPPHLLLAADRGLAPREDGVHRALFDACEGEGGARGFERGELWETPPAPREARASFLFRGNIWEKSCAFSDCRDFRERASGEVLTVHEP